MSLAGLLNILDDDPQLRDVVARAGAGSDPDTNGLAGTDLVAPPALRPVLAAALARGPQGKAPRFVLAVTATARPPECSTLVTFESNTTFVPCEVTRSVQRSHIIPGPSFG